jgi:glucokinase-like ROK family protein
MDNVKIVNSKFIKNLNQSSILRLINDYGPISRKELSEKTDYSAATISNHVKTLIKEGFVIEKEKGISSGGRKPVYLTINPNKGYIIGIDIEVSKVRIVMFNLKLKVEKKVEFYLEANKVPKKLMNKIINIIEGIMKERNIVDYDLLGIGVAVPGLVNKKRNLLQFAPNLGWKEEQISAYLNNRFQVPIFIENEANAAGMGEKEFYYDKDINMVYVSINEGIGCGLIFDGKLHRGASGNAGEFGHIIIESESERICHCGNKGCWEALASGTALSRLAQDAVEADADTMMKDMVTDSSEVDGAIVARAAEKNDGVALDLMDTIAERLGIGLASLINIFNPSRIVFGGGVSNSWSLLEEKINETIAERAMESLVERVEIIPAKLGSDVGVAGAIATALAQVKNK